MSRVTAACLLLLLIGCEKKLPTDPVLRRSGARGTFSARQEKPAPEKAKSAVEQALERTKKRLPERIAPAAEEAVLKFARAIVEGDITACNEHFAVARSFEASNYLIPSLVVALNDSQTRQAAVDYLTAMGRDAEEVVPLLTHMYTSDGSSLSALQAIGPRSVQALAGLLENEVGNIRQRGIDGIKRIGIPVAAWCYGQGRFDEAAATLLIFNEAESLQPDPKLRTHATIYLAASYENLARYDDAEGLLAGAFELAATHFGEESDPMATALNNRGRLYTKLGKYEEAEQFLRQALAVWEKVSGEDHVNVGFACDHLARLYRYQGRLEEARPLIERALSVWQWSGFAYGGQDFTPRALENLACLCRAEMKYDEAEELLKRSLMLREAQLRPNHPDIAAVQDELAQLYDDVGKVAEAEQAALRALEIREAGFGSNHPDVARSRIRLALIYAQQGRAAAAALYEEGRVSLESTVGLELIQDQPLLERARERVSPAPSSGSVQGR